MSQIDTPPSETVEGSDVEPVSHRYDWSETDPSTAIVETIAVATNRVPTETDPLYNVIEPDSLNDLFDPTYGGMTPDLRVSFRYDDVSVSVAATGTVTVRPADDADL